MAGRKTNTEFVEHLMEFSRNGALMQLFILTAIEKYAQQVAASDLKAMEGGMISPQAWKACGVEAITELDTHLSH